MTMPTMREAASYASKLFMHSSGRAVWLKPVLIMDKKAVWEFMGIGHCSSVSGMACSYYPQKSEHFGQQALFDCADCVRLRALHPQEPVYRCLHATFALREEHEAAMPITLAIDTALLLELATATHAADVLIEAKARTALAVRVRAAQRNPANIPGADATQLEVTAAEEASALSQTRYAL
jgi:hypothetical protein